MKKRYKLPIQGKVLARTPLTGDENEPICVVPFWELPGRPTHFNEGSQQEAEDSFRYICLDYNIDEEWCEVELEASEEFHNWLAGILPQLRDIRGTRGWKLIWNTQSSRD